MPTYRLKVPTLNPFNFVDLNREQATAYNFKHFDSWTTSEQVLLFEKGRCYAQKWQITDAPKIQFIADFSPIRLQIRAKSGLIVWQSVMDVKTTISSDIYFEDQIIFSGLDDGYYVLEVLAGDPALITLQSEPFHLQQKQEGTLLFKYSHPSNNNILWETGIEMIFRVDGIIPFDRPDSSRTVYVDQKANMKTVKGDPYRVFRLFVGNTNAGIPNWQIDKLEEIIDQANLEIDGKGFAPVSGANWTAKKVDRYPYHQWSIEMRETNNRRSKLFEVSGLQEKKVIIEYIVESKLFGPIEGDAATNTEYTINELE